MGKIAVCLVLALGAALAGCAKAPEAPKIALQPILYFDVTTNKLYGSGCNFVASDGGMGAVFLAQADRGLIKTGDHIVAIAADHASPALPQGAWQHYAGGGYKATLERVPGGKSRQNGVISVFDATFALSDAGGSELYRATGSAQCKPM